MNLPKDNSIVSEDELQAVMAGISEMTEEILQTGINHRVNGWDKNLAIF